MRFNDRAQRTPIGSGCHDDDRSGSLIRRVRVSREGEITEEKKDAALKGGATKRATKTAARTAEHRNVAPGFSPAFDHLTPLQNRKPKKEERCRPKGRRYEKRYEKRYESAEQVSREATTEAQPCSGSSNQSSGNRIRGSPAEPSRDLFEQDSTRCTRQRHRLLLPCGGRGRNIWIARVDGQISSHR